MKRSFLSKLLIIMCAVFFVFFTAGCPEIDPDTNTPAEQEPPVLEDTSADDVADVFESLSIGFASGDSISSVTQNLTLPVSFENGVSVVWSSSNTDIVSAAGTVIQPAAGQNDAAVTLTAVITKKQCVRNTYFCSNGQSRNSKGISGDA